eukprot:350923-Chlamydomonas_euryale.AAC.5
MKLRLSRCKLTFGSSFARKPPASRRCDAGQVGCAAAAQMQHTHSAAHTIILPRMIAIVSTLTT